ncbi:hypothetical protein QR680_008842 [Steinernema hermaphroditum]|uniref:Transglutaminase-like domain-containing protein n=1 Tax=Steinernema hermaphroditum TaxID=289476 RepID=A0AA39IK05_9BILA|nr:hypothetical protein QR680_008842 [Steinernema hermaphroditum]
MSGYRERYLRSRSVPRRFEDDLWGLDIGGRDDFGIPIRRAQPLRISKVDILSAQNAATNRTRMYGLTQRHPYTLVIRRGVSFVIRVGFNRSFNVDQQELGIVLETGQRPRLERRTKILLSVDKCSSDLAADSWGACVSESYGSQVDIKIQTDVHAIIGVWGFQIVALKEGSIKEELYQHDKHIYMLFNPFHKDDPVYMEDNHALQAYLLEETGELYLGSKSSQISKRPWNFGQFQDECLHATMVALNSYWEEMGTKEEDRSDPIKVSRCMTNLIRLYVLRGRWEEPYNDGAPPWTWNGSVRILKQFLKTRKIVRYGQCWVFGGLLATMLRSLGIPSRVITNYCSAHDSNRDCVLDLSYHREGQQDSRLRSESETLWTFHVWNEAWMRRADLQQQYGSRYDGWQVLDSTPQHVSEDSPQVETYECGPMPLAALRESNLTVPYDGPFIYAEFNADLRRWYYRRGRYGKLELESVETYPNEIGTLLLTSGVHGEILDVTENYKPSESDKEKEREGFNKALRSLNYKTAGLSFRSQDAGRTRTRRSVAPGTTAFAASMVSPTETFGEIDGAFKGDVDFEMTDLKEISIGDDIHWTLVLRNNSDARRSVKVNAQAHVINFMGKEVSQLYGNHAFATVPPRGTHKLHLNIPSDSFETHLGKEWYMSVGMFAVVQETKQLFHGTDKFNVKKPKFTIEIPDRVQAGTVCEVLIRVRNPYKERELTNCELDLEGNGLSTNYAVPITRTIGPGEEVVLRTDFKAICVGATTLIVSFSADELQNLTATKKIEVVGHDGAFSDRF